MLVYSSAGFLVHVRCKTNNNILLFYPFVQHTNDSFVPCFAFVICIMTSIVPFYMDHKPYSYWLRVKNSNHLHRELSPGYLEDAKFYLESKASFIDIGSIASL